MSSAKTVLIIDDEPSVCAYLKDLLEYFGYEVAFALTCREAIDNLKQHPYDCLLLDLYMKNESGEAVLRWLRSMGRTDPVIMMCSMPHYELRLDMIFKGAADLLGKPVQPTQLRQVLQKVIAPPSVPLGFPGEYPGRVLRAF
jgi:CheY-like chemotaxis protein